MTYNADTPWPERYERNVRIVEMFADGKSCRVIAAELGLTGHAVANVLRGAGVDPGLWKAESMTAVAESRRKTERNAEIARAHEAGVTLAEIGRRFGVSRQRVFALVQAKPHDASQPATET